MEGANILSICMSFSSESFDWMWRREEYPQSFCHSTQQDSQLCIKMEKYLPVLDYSSQTTSQPDGLSHWERIAATAQLPQNKLLKKPWDRT